MGKNAVLYKYYCLYFYFLLKHLILSLFAILHNLNPCSEAVNPQLELCENVWHILPCVFISARSHLRFMSLLLAHDVQHGAMYRYYHLIYYYTRAITLLTIIITVNRIQTKVKNENQLQTAFIKALILSLLLFTSPVNRYNIGFY